MRQIRCFFARLAVFAKKRFAAIAIIFRKAPQNPSQNPSQFPNLPTKTPCPTKEQYRAAASPKTPQSRHRALLHAKDHPFFPAAPLQIHPAPQPQLKIHCHGGVFLNQKVIPQSLSSTKNYDYAQKAFNYVEHLGLHNALALTPTAALTWALTRAPSPHPWQDAKNLIKKLYFSHFSRTNRRVKRILKDPNLPKMLFFCPFFSNAYHFCVEAFARLLLLKDYAATQGLDFYIIAPPKYRGYAKYHAWFIDEILALSGVPRGKILYLGYQNYEADNVFFASNAHLNPRYILRAIGTLQRAFYDPDYPPSKLERIYISRKKSPRRFLLNDDEIAAILETRYGFRRIFMEDYPLRDKINIMLRAKIVLSVEGTSAINGFFMQDSRGFAEGGEGANLGESLGGKSSQTPKNPANPLNLGESSPTKKLITIRNHDFTEHLNLIAAMFADVEFLPIIAEIHNQSACENLWVEGDMWLDSGYLEQKLAAYGVGEV